MLSCLCKMYTSSDIALDKFFSIQNTVASRYWTSLISNNRVSRSENQVPILTLKSNNRNIVEKNCSLGAISPLFHNFCYLFLDLHVKAGKRFSLRDKRLFEISRVVCTYMQCNLKKQNPHIFCASFWRDSLYNQCSRWHLIFSWM